MEHPDALRARLAAALAAYDEAGPADRAEHADELAEAARAVLAQWADHSRDRKG